MDKSHISLYRDDESSIVVEFESPISENTADKDIDPVHLVAAAFAYLLNDEEFVIELLNRASEKFDMENKSEAEG